MGVKVLEMLWVILSGQHDQKTLQTKVFPKGLYILLIFIVFWLFNPPPVFDIHVYIYIFFLQPDFGRSTKFEPYIDESDPSKGVKLRELAGDIRRLILVRPYDRWDILWAA